MNRLYVKPAEGSTVRDPGRDGAVLPPEGDFVPREIFWLRRIAQGDVVEARPPKADKSGKAGKMPDPAAKTEG